MKLTILILLLSVQLHAGSHERAQQFFIKHYEAAEQLYFCDSIPIELSLACWALESGYGSSDAATECNNLGGIKSYEGGKKHNKHFATLDNFYTAYAAIFRQPCYSNDMQPKTVDEYLRAMEYACCSYHHSKGYSRKIKWIIKNFKLNEMIIHGCCMKEIKNISSKSIDAIICDLPYGVTRNKWDSVLPMSILWNQYRRVIKDNGIIILFAQGLFSTNLMLSNKDMYRYSLVWEKTTPTGFLNANRQPLRNHEDILIFYKKQPTYNPIKTRGHKRKQSKQGQIKDSETRNYGARGARSYDSTERFPKSVLKFATDKQKAHYHPTQKPVALLEYLIKTFTNEMDLILDNTAGSGSTGVAAKNTNRKYILIEKEKKYIEIIKKRLK